VFDTFYKFAVLLLLFGLVMRARWAGLGCSHPLLLLFSQLEYKKKRENNRALWASITPRRLSPPPFKFNGKYIYF
jgi:hypothetical protein